MPIVAILAGAKTLAEKFFSFAETWVGGALIAFAVAWLWSGWRHDAACSAREAAAKAAAQAQINQWKTAAEDVARDATARVEEDVRAAQAQKDFISSLPTKDRPHAPSAKDDLATDFSDRPLFLDPDYIAVVRAFDAAGDRGSDPTRSAKELRQAGALAKSDRCAALKVWGLRNRAVASEANRRLVSDGLFYNDVLRKFSAGSRRRVAPPSHEE
ncbi:hypothetical protein F7D13_07015 [Methylocystis rosea]|uniref:Uncharacterized protein n=1 Tax=Methylocystis rosea TaxID=173366 RepID=A0ABX6EG87_9HYPH|nr:hypothetical protein [Methylocystis rosea]QGM93793.1 hypothetical protein F7D13_07015 [Methylocystis rosea]